MRMPKFSIEFCDHCEQPIGDQMVVAGGKVYHPKCYAEVLKEEVRVEKVPPPWL